MRETKQWFQHNNRTLRVGSRGLIYPEGLKGFSSIHETTQVSMGCHQKIWTAKTPLDSLLHLSTSLNKERLWRKGRLSMEHTAFVRERKEREEGRYDRERGYATILHSQRWIRYLPLQ